MRKPRPYIPTIPHPSKFPPRCAPDYPAWDELARVIDLFPVKGYELAPYWPYPYRRGADAAGENGGGK